MTQEDQTTLLGRIRKLSDTIADIRRRFALPKGHKDRNQTWGAASGLQRAKRERSELQAQLDPIRLIATGVSCRDCRFYDYFDGERLCTFAEKDDLCGVIPTSAARLNSNLCGPEARCFQPKEA